MDALAFILICTGTSLCVNNSHMEQVEYPTDELIRMLFYERSSGLFFLYMFFFIFVAYTSLEKLLQMVASLGLDLQKYYSTVGGDDEEKVNLTLATSEDQSTNNEVKKNHSASAKLEMPYADVIELVLKTSEGELCKFTQNHS